MGKALERGERREADVIDVRGQAQSICTHSAWRNSGLNLRTIDLKHTSEQLYWQWLQLRELKFTLTKSCMYSAKRKGPVY
eukprot:2890927-Amphidinium_carterae.1